jgi:Ring finger domain
MTRNHGDNQGRTPLSFLSGAQEEAGRAIQEGQAAAARAVQEGQAAAARAVQEGQEAAARAVQEGQAAAGAAVRSAQAAAAESTTPSFLRRLFGGSNRNHDDTSSHTAAQEEEESWWDRAATAYATQESLRDPHNTEGMSFVEWLRSPLPNQPSMAAAAAAAFTPAPAPPPVTASLDAVRSLPAIRVTNEDLFDPAHRECAVCFEPIKLRSQVIRLPCSHLFHPSCIRPWLLQHSHTCPTCRYELPTGSTSEEERVRRMQTQRGPPRFAAHELQRLTIRQLKELLTLQLQVQQESGRVSPQRLPPPFFDKNELIQYLIDNHFVFITPTPPPVTINQSQLNSMTMKQLITFMNDELGIFFERSLDIVEKQDLLNLLFSDQNSHRIHVIQDEAVEESDQNEVATHDHAKKSRASPSGSIKVETVEHEDSGYCCYDPEDNGEFAADHHELFMDFDPRFVERAVAATTAQPGVDVNSPPRVGRLSSRTSERNVDSSCVERQDRNEDSTSGSDVDHAGHSSLQASEQDASTSETGLAASEHIRHQELDEGVSPEGPSIQPFYHTPGRESISYPGDAPIDTQPPPAQAATFASLSNDDGPPVTVSDEAHSNVPESPNSIFTPMDIDSPVYHAEYPLDPNQSLDCSMEDADEVLVTRESVSGPNEEPVDLDLMSPRFSPFNQWDMVHLRLFASVADVLLSEPSLSCELPSIQQTDLCDGRESIIQRLVNARDERADVQHCLTVFAPLIHLSVAQLRKGARLWNVDISGCLEKGEILRQLVQAVAVMNVSQLLKLARETSVDISDCREKKELLHRLVDASC